MLYFKSRQSLSAYIYCYKVFYQEFLGRGFYCRKYVADVDWEFPLGTSPSADSYHPVWFLCGLILELKYVTLEEV